MRVPLRSLVAWCGPCLPVAALGLPLIVYLPPYYAGTLGLPLATVGFIFFLVRVIDIPIDPFIGALMDNTRSRFGRFRPWLLSGSFVLALGVWGVFMAKPGVTALGLTAWLLLLYLGWSMVYLSQTSWGSTLSPDYAERARVFGWWSATNVIGLLLVLIIPPLVARLLPGEGVAPGIHAMGWFIMALLPTTALAAVLLVGDGPAPPEQHRVRLADVRAVLGDGRMQRLLWVDLLLGIAPGITGALFLFFFTAAKGMPAATASLLLLGYFVAGLAAAPLWIRLAQRLGKHQALAIAALWFMLTNAGIVLLPNDNVPVAAIAMIVAGIPYAAGPFLLRAMLSDLTDAQRAERGDVETTGLSFAILTATQKIGYGIPVGLTYPALALIGFDPRPGAANSANAILGLELIFSIPTAILALTAAILIRKWPITAAAHAAIRARLDARTNRADPN
ncbi:MFS transporter [Sandaracinobacteroides saxicola]|uniref:MFS transporter n=1 Tax=Sandaracinobacteroides saxicola TaxID=2759707 RepID=A0A7G5II26_9SPHN|nr:MFS transporter [Sandaracinobacteroides saxicola]QMW23018.1 MFS transporter [Sandaracinobacteroides saxicola]